MTANFCRSLTPTILVIAMATFCAAVEPRGSSLRLVSGEEPPGPRFESSRKENAPSFAPLPTEGLLRDPLANTAPDDDVLPGNAPPSSSLTKI